MVSFNVYRATSSGAYIEGVCLASDEKPIVGISNGSILYAVDASDGTTTRYMFDQSTASWIEAECPGGGGGGGSGSGGTLIVTGTYDAETDRVVAIDKSYNELKAAYDAGTTVIVRTDRSVEDFTVYTDDYLCALGLGPTDSVDLNNGITYFALFLSGGGYSVSAFRLSANDNPDAPLSYDDGNS